MSSSLRFTIEKSCKESGARVGRIETPHGSFDTPAFMPVGTRGSLKGILPQQVAETGTQIVLNNAYHLMLRPGDELVARLGGVHRFMGWSGPILTDSGGYQAFSMADINSVDDDGVTFRSIIDGSLIHLTPERAIEVQNNLGADIIMAFDDCPPAPTPSPHQVPGEPPGAQCPPRRVRQAHERTIRWLERCVTAHSIGPKADVQALFGIVQGGTDLGLRRASVEAVCSLDLPGFAIGGVAVGEGPELIRTVTAFTAPLLPQERPRYLMGVGYERDIVMAVRAGVDMFDCVLPTRNGRNANVFTRTGVLRLRNAAYREDPRPIEEGCDCAACVGAVSRRLLTFGQKEEVDSRQMAADSRQPFSRAYLRHLFMSGEMLGPILASIHNVRHFQRLMLDIRRAIREDAWSSFHRSWPVLEMARDA
jgi:queuine tRNA-ribosyltransferase